jgi:hypothetical protein
MNRRIWVVFGRSLVIDLDMGKFGFEPHAPAKLRDAPAGYATATVYLGEHSETANFRSTLWSPADYVQHWHQAASALLRGEAQVLFCTDYDTVSCLCFVGWTGDNGFVFEEWVIKRRNLSGEGLRLGYIGEHTQPSADVSHFHVPAADLKAFVQSCA